MTKVNFDAKRSQILKQIHADKMKAAEKAKKDAARQAAQAPVVDDTIVDIGVRIDMVIADEQVVVVDTQAA